MVGQDQTEVDKWFLRGIFGLVLVLFGFLSVMVFNIFVSLALVAVGFLILIWALRSGKRSETWKS